MKGLVNYRLIPKKFVRFDHVFVTETSGKFTLRTKFGEKG